VLATAKLDAQAAAGGAPRGDVVALAAKVRELARRATKLTDQDARAELYGELLSTCAGCHQLVRPRPVPGP
jgi:mono/diheme cytochrome c family protein